jgi:diadenylate cyclase
MDLGIAGSFFSEFRDNFRVTDAVDILLMSVFLYSALAWFRETASRRVLIGVSVLVAVYGLARAFDMYLISLLFHTGFAVLLIVLIVIFQEDLRRMFERVAAWGSLEQVRQTPSARTDIDALVEAVFTLAEHKTGALIVLKGNEPLERHLDGGITVGGELSKPLLYSIFDASSPGHDGAVILEHGQLSKFAAHLPISKNQPEIAGRGTRHSAALGLSECSDALVIVVSEERGGVSAAEAGRLRELATAAALKARIEEFLAAKFPVKAQATWRRYVVEHWPLKGSAIGLAVVAWMLLAYRPSTLYRTFILPIEYRNLGGQLLLDDDAPHEARVTVSGSERGFRFLEPGALKLSIDLAGSQAGEQEIAVSERNIRLPGKLDLYRIEPQPIVLRLRPKGDPEP